MAIIKLSSQDISTLWTSAVSERDQDRYLAEWSSSSIFFPTDSSDAPNTADLGETLQNIWELANFPFRVIWQRSGLTQSAFSSRFCLPYRTLQNWVSRDCCPDYVRLMLVKELDML